MFTKMIFSQILIRISSPSGNPSKLSSTKARYSSAFPVVSLSKPLFGFLFLIFCSCSTTKTVPVEAIKEVQVHDTIVVQDFQFDSIYIASNHFIDRGKDTVIIQDQQIEYRYRILRDTIRITKVEIQRDSVPYEVRIVETIEVEKHPKLFDYLCYLSFGILIGITGWKLIKLITGWKLIKLIPSRH